MDTTEEIVDIDEVVMQAWKSDGIAATRSAVERRLKQERAERLAAYRAKGLQAYGWGYVRRKVLMTPVGNLGPILIPRIRVEGREVRLIPRYIRRIRPLDLLTAEATILGISQRRMGDWLNRANGQRISAATVGRIVEGIGGGLSVRRWLPLDGTEYAALATDAIWGTYRGNGDAALAIGIGVRWDGTFEVLDWEAGASESAELYEALFTRLWERGLKELELIVGDAAASIESAKEMVYPSSFLQLCLWHWGRTLRRHVGPDMRRRFSRDFWEVYNGLDIAEVEHRARLFCRRWQRRDPQIVERFRERYTETLGYLRFPAEWRHRVRTVNLAEGFFRNLRRYFNRFPGFQDPEHLSRVIGLYLLGAEPERWRDGRISLVA